jgi:hypothetical protein
MIKNIFMCFIILTSINVWSQNIQPINARVNINGVMSLKVVKTGNLDFKFNTVDDLIQGSTKLNMFSVDIKSNKNWNLSVSSLTENFLAAGPNSSTDVSSSIVSIKRNTSSNFVPITQNPASIATGVRGANTTASRFNLDLKVTPGLNYDGGFYTVVVLFTISPQ